MVLPNDKEARGIPTTCGANALADANADEADDEHTDPPPGWLERPLSRFLFGLRM